jgi:hypothetical protein
MPSGRTQRTILLTGALVLGLFFLVAFGFRRAGVSQGTLSIVGGIMAYLFLAAVVAILVIGWRSSSRSAGRSRWAGRRARCRRAAGLPRPT